MGIDKYQRRKREEFFEPPEACTSTVFPPDPAGKTAAFPQDAARDRSVHWILRTICPRQIYVGRFI